MVVAAELAYLKMGTLLILLLKMRLLWSIQLRQLLTARWSAQQWGRLLVQLGWERLRSARGLLELEPTAEAGGAVLGPVCALSTLAQWPLVRVRCIREETVHVELDGFG